jgi:hypothetical protein
MSEQKAIPRRAIERAVKADRALDVRRLRELVKVRAQGAHLHPSDLASHFDGER